MAPRKRLKGQSSSTAEPEQEYDKTKFVSFDAPPPPERPPADDEDHEEERLEEVGQGHEEEDQDEGMDGGYE